jgi:hypothetical protein
MRTRNSGGNRSTGPEPGAPISAPVSTRTRRWALGGNGSVPGCGPCAYSTAQRCLWEPFTAAKGPVLAKMWLEETSGKSSKSWCLLLLNNGIAKRALRTTGVHWHSAIPASSVEASLGDEIVHALSRPDRRALFSPCLDASLSEIHHFDFVADLPSFLAPCFL